MADVALGKPVEGAGNSITKLEVITDGITRGHTGRDGFGLFPCPGTIVLDLESVQRIYGIRMLLWDNDGRTAGRKYKYCIEASIQKEEPIFSWDIGEEGSDGLQEFFFGDGWLYARYIHIHAIRMLDIITSHFVYWL